jgi:hypothetical protein
VGWAEGCTWRLGKRELGSEVTEGVTRVIAVWGFGEFWRFLRKWLLGVRLG